MKIRAIPQVPNQLDSQLRAVLLAMKENLEMLAGQRGDENPVEAVLGYEPARASSVSRLDETAGFAPVLLYVEHTSGETPAALGTLTGWTVQINTGGGAFSSGVFTIPASGRYRVFVSIMLDVGVSDSGIYVKINSTLKPRIIYCSGTGYPTASGEQVFDLVAGDTVQLVSQYSKAWFGAPLPNGPGHWLVERIRA